MKQISIITINYNNASGLEKTIRSVVEQTYNEYEYIIIDGASCALLWMNMVEERMQTIGKMQTLR